MKSLIRFVFVFTTLVGQILFAEDLGVDRVELSSYGDQSIQFINYEGPHEFINTLDQIRNIGRGLGSGVALTVSDAFSVNGKYRVLHIVNPELDGGLDADIFILEEDAAVDHIKNLRTIVAGYLETAYGYDGRNAYLLAEFATYYNAVFRGNDEVVRERYKSPVADALVQPKIGLDTHYSQWPGKTMMLIPLRYGDGPTGSPVVDTGPITEPEVIEKLREEEDMGLRSRRDMVKLREKEITKEQSALDERRKDLEESAKAVRKDLESEELSSERREELQEEQAAIEKERRELEEHQKDLDERTEEVLDMRDDIARDENILINQKEDPVEEEFVSDDTPVWFLKVDAVGDDGIPFGRVVKYGLDTGRLMAVSRLTSVRGRSMVGLPDTLLVIAGRENGNARVRLLLLDREDLTTFKEGTQDVFPGSLMVVRDEDVYLVTTEAGEWRLGRFNTALGREAVSEVSVYPWTSISFVENSVYVQGEEGEILKLSASTLRLETTLQ